MRKALRPKSLASLMIVLAVVALGIAYAVEIQRGVGASVVIGNVETVEDTILVWGSVTPEKVPLTDLAFSSGPHHQDSGEAKIRESTAGVSRKPSSDCKACGCSSKHLCGLTAWNT